jgi:excisionase family DNA binding protein
MAKLMSAQHEVLTVVEVAARLRISRNHCYALIAAGELPVLRLGRKIVIPAAQFERLLAGSVVGTLEPD